MGVEGLPRKMKTVVMLLVIVPHLVSCVLVFVAGCRWLLATDNIEDIFVNTVALEFMLAIPDIMYVVLTPQRSKVAVVNTFIVPYRERENVSAVAFFDSYFWLVLAIFWVWLYVNYMQAVLPDYRWDVRDLCDSHLQ